MPHQLGTLARLAGMTLVSLSMVGCLSLGARTLKIDQADYARALGAAKKRAILSLIVGLRYADTPAFLTVTQVISGYTYTASAIDFVRIERTSAGMKARFPKSASRSLRMH